MDPTENILTSYAVDRDEWMVEFYWVTPEFIDLMESMMRNFISFRHPKLGDHQFAILSISVYWDLSDQSVLEAYGGQKVLLQERSHRNMDARMKVIDETA